MMAKSKEFAERTLKAYAERLEKDFQEEAADAFGRIYNGFAEVIVTEKATIETILMAMEVLKFDLLKEQHEKFLGPRARVNHTENGKPVAIGVS